jgi:2-(3-amino-3-carboxypropyl)histidine synthase
LYEKLRAAGKRVRIVTMPEITPAVLKCFEGVEAWVQVACPRLSIDWGYSFNVPLLSPFELNVVLGSAAIPDDHYPMDYYSFDSLGPWSNYYWNNNNGSNKRTGCCKKVK